MRDLHYTISCSLLNSLFDNELYFNEPYFDIDKNVFLNPFHQTVAERISLAIQNKESLVLLKEKFDDWIETKPNLHQQWIDILTQHSLPMSSAKSHYNDLRIKYFTRLKERLVK